MGVYWLMAEEAEAAAVARSVSRGVYEYESLSMAGLQPDEFAALWGLLQGPLGSAETTRARPSRRRLGGERWIRR